MIRPKDRHLLVVAATLLLATLALVGRDAPAVSADTTVTWQKVPDHAQVIACDQTSSSCPPQPADLGGGVWLNGIVLTEVMNNQSDPNGFGGYQLDVLYDPFAFQAAAVVDLGVLNDSGVRVTSCRSSEQSPGDTLIVCASTGPFGVGATWTGPMMIAKVTLKLQPGVFQTIQAGPSGGLATTIRDSVRVSNTCGQPLNDGSIQPIPGQKECDGNLLPGLGAGGVVLNPGNSAVTITRSPSTPTPTATAAGTGTSTAIVPVPTATSTRVQTFTPTPQSTGTPPPTETTSPSSTPAATASPGFTATPAAFACPRTLGFWKNHPEAWPLSSLTLGNQSYDQAEALAILDMPLAGDASRILSPQLIAAKLNVASGFIAPPAVSTAITRADALLGMFDRKVPLQIDPSSWEGQGMVWVAVVLDRYNNCLPPPGVGPGGAGPTTGPTAFTTVLGVLRPSRTAVALPGTGDDGQDGGWPTVLTIIAAVIMGMASVVLLYVRHICGGAGKG